MAVVVERLLAQTGCWRPLPGERIDPVHIDRSRAEQPFGRVTSEAGVDLVLRMARGARLVGGDLLGRVPGAALVAAVAYPKVLEIALPKTPWNAEQANWAVRLGHFLGNRHLPVRLVPAGLRIVAENPRLLAEQIQQQWGSNFCWAVRRGEPEDPPPNSHAHGR